MCVRVYGVCMSMNKWCVNVSVSVYMCNEVESLIHFSSRGGLILKRRVRKGHLLEEGSRAETGWSQGLSQQEDNKF